ncbi:MAG TPA: MerR family transcriptional regulator [Gammaproteobacteria bacterium]|nr:MerR family transcriptional regulator [Gammaproteobacteria bacterium]
MNNADEGRLTIGAVARKAGVHVETVRYYQRKGLLPEPPRPPGGVRYYGPEVVDLILFIKQVQYLGFTLREVADLLSFAAGDCTKLEWLAEAKLSEVDSRLTDLGLVREELEQLLRECREGRIATDWGLVEAVIGKKRGSGTGEG